MLFCETWIRIGYTHVQRYVDICTFIWKHMYVCIYVYLRGKGNHFLMRKLLCSDKDKYISYILILRGNQ